MTETGFSRYGLTHLSPSQINKFTAAPCAWLNEYVLKKGQFQQSWAMLRGTATELAIDAFVRQGKDYEASVELAEKFLEKETAGWADQSAGLDKHVPIIERWVDQGSRVLASKCKSFETLEAQKDIFFEIPLKAGGSVGIKGIMDWIATSSSQRPMIIDLKTSKSLWRKTKFSHLVQGAIYAAAQVEEPNVAFLYAVERQHNPIEWRWFGHDDMATALHHVLRTANAINNLLLTVGPEMIENVLVPDPDNFHYN